MGERPGTRETIDRMAGDLIQSGRGKMSREKAYEIAKGAAERVEHGSGRPTEDTRRKK